ncbi:hypothetical protein ACF0H5_004269 [Mactra antiquata]
MVKNTITIKPIEHPEPVTDNSHDLGIICATTSKSADIMFLVTLLLLWITPVSASVFPNLDHIRPSASLRDQRQAAQDLIVRVLGVEKSQRFHVVLLENLDPEFKDTINLLSNEKNVTISATSGYSAALGFYHFIKTYCGCQFTWAGEQLNLPSSFPTIPKPGITIKTNDRFKYYQNVCTVSYSFVWWDWKRWERHIDWMAMNGINLPLAFTGQEAIFQRVYRKMGFTDQQLQDHFGGPAFLAWSRMGNMHGWGGPLPQSWIDGQLVLQHKILTRMRQLGMTPVLPGFAGHVPMAITKLYPNAKVTRLSDWGHFNNTYCCTYLLDFHDPLFQEIGTALIKEMQSEFGVDHVYNADSFNEMDPSSSDPEYLKSAGSMVYKAMSTADPQAIWLMQGWLFSHNTDFWMPPQVKALLTSVPQGKMIILDLFAEVLPVYSNTSSFYGQPFIWCMLHNFGGTMELYGVKDTVNEGPFKARSYPNGTMIGTGLTPEGIFQNEAIYELMNENVLATKPRNLTVWFSNFAKNRYEQSNEFADKAWQLLRISVYNNTDRLHDHSKNVIPTSLPKLKHPLMPDIWYRPSDLYGAWMNMVNASDYLWNSTLFRYDLVDIARDSLQLLSFKYYTEIITAYNSKNMNMLQTSGGYLIHLLIDLEHLISSDSHFLLEPWIRDARNWGNNTNEKDLMEYNARNQITLWGPTGQIRDYAAKQWSGVFTGYYTRRWMEFINDLTQCLEMGIKFDDDQFKVKVLNTIEIPFTMEKTEKFVTSKGDSVQIARNLYKKYLPAMKSGFFKHIQNWSLQGEKTFRKLSQQWVKNNWTIEKEK